jgi:hypothetical protein
MKPPGRANAFTDGSSTTWNDQGRFGRSESAASFLPRFET